MSPVKRRPFRLDARRVGALLAVGSISAILVGYFVWMVQPAAARETDAACKGMRGNPQNPVLGRIPRPAPDVSLKGIDGREVKISDYKGKVVLVHFWASWCGACEDEKPTLMAMTRDLAGPDFAVVTIASDMDWAAVKKSLPDGAPYQVFLDPPAEEGRIGPLTGTWGTKAVPESFLIDRKGRLRYWFDNRRDWDSAVVETCLQSIIDEE
ncbi:MAG: TlpA family protein disulfide reductase [Deltaproteobacteria bacterium]|nr:TlpA family protein disulfide reductase [Deltaproteobacteria bacterium]